MIRAKFTVTQRNGPGRAGGFPCRAHLCLSPSLAPSVSHQPKQRNGPGRAGGFPCRAHLCLSPSLAPSVSHQPKHRHRPRRARYGGGRRH